MKTRSAARFLNGKRPVYNLRNRTAPIVQREDPIPQQVLDESLQLLEKRQGEVNQLKKRLRENNLIMANGDHYWNTVSYM